MIKYKDTGRITKDITLKNIEGNLCIIKAGSIVVIDKAIGGEYLVMITDPTPPDDMHTKFFKVKKNNIDINYSDVTRDIIIPQLISNGFPEKLLIKNIVN